MRSKSKGEKVDIHKFDFLDFGASKSASIDYGIKHFFAKRGLGIDLDEERVRQMNESGYDCMVGDLTNLSVPDNCVRFVKMAHILEHMPNLNGVEKAIASAKRAATDFLVITGPFFDEDAYLRSKGLKLDWSDYPEHTCHLTIKQLLNILKKLNINTYEMYVRYKIADSSSDRIHPLSSPVGSHQYNPKIHPPKKKIKFNKDVWTDFVCYIKLKEVKNWNEITKAYKDQIPFSEMRDGTENILSDKQINLFNELNEESQQKTSAIHGLEQDKNNLTRRVATLKEELNKLQASKAWRATQFMQKIPVINRSKKS